MTNLQIPVNFKADVKDVSGKKKDADYETLKQKLNYLHENPVRAGIVYEIMAL